MTDGALHLGTSGWTYPHWRGVLYARGCSPSRWLARYAELFSTVEVNASFYRLMSRETYARWRDETPKGFVFAVKGSRFLTHMKRLLDVDEGVRHFLEPLRGLGRKIGPILWQLPPRFRVDHARLDRFLRALPRSRAHVFEFRAVEWYVEETCAVLDRHGAAFCEHDLVDRLPPRPTGGFRYLRFHGTRGKYGGRYGRAALGPHARDLDRWRASGRDAWIYFNNDVGGAAVRDALDLGDMLSIGTTRADGTLCA